MANYISGKCSCCGKTLKNSILKYTSRGKLFCFDCYQKEASRIEEEQSKQDDILEYIKKTFSVSTLKEEVINGIDSLMKEGKTEEDILYVLYYIYEIAGQDLNKDFIILNIKRFYKEALEYRDKQEQLSIVNKKKEITQESVSIKIKKSDLDEKSKPKFGYKMEDL